MNYPYTPKNCIYDNFRRVGQTALRAVLGIYLMACCAILQARAEEPGAPMLITHPSNTYLELQDRTVRGIFSMRLQTWPNGSALTVFVFSDDTDLHKQFCKDRLGVLPYYLRKNWDRLIFSGSGKAPIVVSNIEEMKTKITNTPGSIGYISKEHINESIKILNVRN